MQANILNVSNLIVNFIKKHNFFFQNKNLQWIEPSDIQFPGFQKIYDEISDWEWIYGRTPKFSLKRHFVKNMEYFIEHSVTIDIEMDKGRITNINIDTNFNETFSKIEPIILDNFIGSKFWFHDLRNNLFKVKHDLTSFNEKELNDWVVYCLSKTLFVA